MSNDFTDKTQEVKDIITSLITGEMTNGAAIGYMIMAAKDLELSLDTTRSLACLMLEKMDLFTEEQAEREYRTF